MWFHVTSVRNRASIEAHGLDWSLMGAAAGIAGSAEPEVAGCFVCSADDVDFFVRINNTGGAVDVWAVTLASDEEPLPTPNGFSYVPHPIPPAQLRLVSTDLPPVGTGGRGPTDRTQRSGS